MGKMMRVALLLGALLVVATSSKSASDRPTWREIWGGWSHGERLRFAEGYESAWQAAILMSQRNPLDMSKELRDLQTRYVLPAGQLVELLDHFYADPANQHINLESAFYLAVGKFRGEELEASLNRHRKLGLELYEATRSEQR